MSDVAERDERGRIIALSEEEGRVYHAAGLPFVLKSEIDAKTKAEDAASRAAERSAAAGIQRRAEAAPVAPEDSTFAKLDAKRDADLAPLWAAYADEHAHQMRNDAGRSRRRLQLAGYALRDAGVPTDAVKAYGEDLEIARQRGRPVPAPSFSIEAAARDERDRLRKKDPPGATPDGRAAWQSWAIAQSAEASART